MEKLIRYTYLKNRYLCIFEQKVDQTLSFLRNSHDIRSKTE